MYTALSSLQMAEEVLRSGPVSGEGGGGGGGGEGEGEGEGRATFEGMEALARAIETGKMLQRSQEVCVREFSLSSSLSSSD